MSQHLTAEHNFNGNASSGVKLFLSLACGQYQPDQAWARAAWRRKFALRACLAPISTIRLLAMLSSLPLSMRILKAQPTLPTRLQRPYLTANSTPARTLQALSDHYRILLAHFSAVSLRQLFSAQGLRCSEIIGKEGHIFYIDLVTDPKMNKEGEATLLFRCADATVLASMTFTLCTIDQKRTLFIGGLQGPKARVPHTRIHDATKACYGLFPKRILLEGARQIAAFTGAEQLVAVSNATHIYQHWRYARKKKAQFLADYDSFWQSMGGTQTTAGNFALPLIAGLKALSDIPSKKRAEYRRRYGLLADISQSIQHHLADKTR